MHFLNKTMEFFFVAELSAAHSGLRCSSGHNGDAVAQHREFPEIGGNQQDFLTPGLQRAGSTHRSVRGRHVDAGGRFVEQQDIRCWMAPFTKHNFLLITSR